MTCSEWQQRDEELKATPLPDLLLSRHGPPFFLTRFPRLFRHYWPNVNRAATDAVILLSTLHTRALEMRVCCPVYSHYWLKCLLMPCNLRDWSIIDVPSLKPEPGGTVAGLCWCECWAQSTLPAALRHVIRSTQSSPHAGLLLKCQNCSQRPTKIKKNTQTSVPPSRWREQFRSARLCSLRLGGGESSSLFFIG